MSGLVEENKMWGVMMGERDCGKGGSTRMNEMAFGPYVNTVNSKSFIMQRGLGGDAAKGQSWMLSCEYTRISYTQEITVDVSEKSIKVDGNAIKQFASGGDRIMARKNYQDEVEFRVQSMLIMNCNDLPPITPTDALENMVMFNCPHKFVSAVKLAEEPRPHYLVKDDGIKAYSARPDVMDAYTWLVIDAFKSTAFEASEIVKRDIRKFIKKGNDDMEALQRGLRFGGVDDNITKDELEAFLKNSGLNMSLAKLVETIERMGAKADKNLTRNGKRGKRGFKHVRVIEDEDEEPIAV